VSPLLTTRVLGGTSRKPDRACNRGMARTGGRASLGGVGSSSGPNIGYPARASMSLTVAAIALALCIGAAGALRYAPMWLVRDCRCVL
jgi:hypothetical protein